MSTSDEKEKQEVEHELPAPREARRRRRRRSETVGVSPEVLMTELNSEVFHLVDDLEELKDQFAENRSDTRTHLEKIDAKVGLLLVTVGHLDKNASLRSSIIGSITSGVLVVLAIKFLGVTK